jgi:hypothetical protein
MTALYAATLALSAALLFAVQPMVGKAVLPALGGTPAAWTTCLAFFQTTLLVGYALAHAAARRGPRLSTLAFPALVLAAWALAPTALDVPGPPADARPAAWLLGFLVGQLGVPALALTLTAPLLQAWYAHAGRSAGRDPYPLYAASNLGSLAGLLGYPLLVEPRWGLQAQLAGGRVGLLALAVLASLCAWPARRSLGSGEASRTREAEPISPRRWLRWLGLALVPSLLLVGATQYITTDLAAVPLLWALPLALYLLSFVVAFSGLAAPATARAARAFPVVLIALSPALAAGLVQPWYIPVHLLALALGTLLCHGTLAAERPPPERLTAFYLAMAAGGALGGLFAALVAPLVFDRIAEYPLALFAAAALPTFSWPLDGRRSRWTLAAPAVVFLLTAGLVRDVGGIASTAVGAILIMIVCGTVALACVYSRRRPVAFAMTLGAAVAGCGLADARDGGLLWRGRDFFGVLRVTRDARAGVTRLFHGTTLHGEQAIDPAQRREPRSYFARGGPIGQVFEALARRPEPIRRVVVVGLGAGSLAAYARPGEAWTFLELDPAVVRVAQDPRFFTYLADCRAVRLDVRTGDARLLLRDDPAIRADLLILDAFGSDAVPVHLLTREALRLYLDRLAPGGLLAFNITNRYLDLEPVLAALAAAEGLVARVRYDVNISDAERSAGKQPTIWAVLARREGDLQTLGPDPAWKPAQASPGRRAWTDDFADPLGCLTLRRAAP